MVALFLPTLMFITASSLFTPGTADYVQAHTGTSKGTAHNAAGPCGVTLRLAGQIAQVVRLGRDQPGDLSAMPVVVLR